MLVGVTVAVGEFEVMFGVMSGGLWAVVGVSEVMTTAVVMVRGVEVATDKPLTEGEGVFVVVRAGKRAETSAFQENISQAKHNITIKEVPTSLKGATCCILLQRRYYYLLIFALIYVCYTFILIRKDEVIKDQ